MMQTILLSPLTVSGTALAQTWSTVYTSTATADVAKAAATAKTSSPTNHVKGKAFDRLAIIWLENTDYTLAAGDPNLEWLANKGITLSTTSPSLTPVNPTMSPP